MRCVVLVCLRACLRALCLACLSVCLLACVRALVDPAVQFWDGHLTRAARGSIKRQTAGWLVISRTATCAVRLHDFVITAPCHWGY